jgi:amidase
VESVVPQVYEMSATKLVEKIRYHALSATEVAQGFIDRIRDVNPLINALQQFDPGRILKEAREADDVIKSSKKLGRLHGLPITVKDACHVKGFKCSKGFPGFIKTSSTYDATVVARLKDAGAIILGITNTPELLLSYETDNLIYGRTNNPYDLRKTPGGSSGGEAALISAGGSPVGIGSDAGGSIRQPAHYSGICGHKPTQGLVPSTGSVPVDGAGIITQVLSMGPMSRCAEDLSLLMRVMSGYDRKDPHSVPVLFGDSESVNIHKLRVAYFYDNGDTLACDETVKVINSVIDALASEVQSIKKTYPKPLKNIYRLHWETFMLGGDRGESLKQLYKRFGQQNISKLAQEFIVRAEGCHFSMEEFRQRFSEVEQFRFQMMLFMENYDLILSPVSATPARFHGETHKNIADFSYTIVHNLTGWPATVVPCGLSKDGLPIGIQIASTPWNDHVCLAVAEKVQQIFGVLPIPEIRPFSPQ